MNNQIILLAILSILTLSFKSDKNKVVFKYPKLKGVDIVMNTSVFRKFKKEWRGKDYYYLCEKGQNDIVCSVLFYKLNEKEKMMYVDLTRAMIGKECPEVSPVFPLEYFSNYSNLKKYETNHSKWGNLKGDFMFRHADIKEFNGAKINQKHMYAYTMVDNDLFVNIHLSKIFCTKNDSIFMAEILNSLNIRN
ncbi:hypothetical protein [Marinifilum sp. D714]|uniref:hypothetical protein n=1 Tax=Marinifilum sp. D714 TaxID=2937523 RepID=UPI0027C527D4|nr:hypothetical protein [Marinifilum sp. D714]MDQ2180234.1 hypothetical protein [Marinifilum sp. D714]